MIRKVLCIIPSSEHWTETLFFIPGGVKTVLVPSGRGRGGLQHSEGLQSRWQHLAAAGMQEGRLCHLTRWLLETSGGQVNGKSSNYNAHYLFAVVIVSSRTLSISAWWRNPRLSLFRIAALTRKNVEKLDRGLSDIAISDVYLIIFHFDVMYDLKLNVLLSC